MLLPNTKLKDVLHDSLTNTKPEDVPKLYDAEVRLLGSENYFLWALKIRTEFRDRTKLTINEAFSKDSQQRDKDLVQRRGSVLECLMVATIPLNIFRECHGRALTRWNYLKDRYMPVQEYNEFYKYISSILTNYALHPSQKSYMVRQFNPETFDLYDYDICKEFVLHSNDSSTAYVYDICCKSSKRFTFDDFSKQLTFTNRMMSDVDANICTKCSGFGHTVDSCASKSWYIGEEEILPPPYGNFHPAPSHFKERLIGL